MSLDLIAIADGRKTLLFPVQCLTAQAIHLGFTVRDIRSQLLQLHFNAPLFAKAALVVFDKSSSAVMVPQSFLLTLLKIFLYLVALDVADWIPLPEFGSAAARREVNIST